MTERALIYTRQSTYREESISLELQERACREYATSRGYRVVGVLSDPGVSGNTLTKRPGMRAAVERIQSGDASVVLVYRWSRLSRNHAHQAVILDRIESASGRVESATEPVDSTRASGRFGRNVLLAAAVFEYETKSEQWKEVQARRVALGLMPGGPAPWGYVDPTRRGEPPEPDPTTAPVLAELYASYLRGTGVQALAKRLNDAGHVTRPGGAWTAVQVQRLLDSGFAAGLLRLDGGARWERGAQRPVIDESAWRSYREERDRRRRRFPNPKNRHPRWHLAGFTVCERCGGSLIVNSYSSKKSQAICGTYKTSRTCPGVWIDRARLEFAFTMWLAAHATDWANAQDSMSDATGERDELAKDVAHLQGELDRLDRGRANLARALALGEVTREDHATARASVEEARRDVSARLDDARVLLDALSDESDLYDRLVAATEGQTATEWNQVLARVVRRIVVGPETVTIEPWRGEPHVVQRSAFAPRRPPRGDRETPRGGDGRFVRRVAP